jgi:hypothetical protein
LLGISSGRDKKKFKWMNYYWCCSNWVVGCTDLNSRSNCNAQYDIMCLRIIISRNWAPLARFTFAGGGVNETEFQKAKSYGRAKSKETQ